MLKVMSFGTETDFVTVLYVTFHFGVSLEESPDSVKVVVQVVE